MPDNRKEAAKWLRSMRTLVVALVVLSCFVTRPALAQSYAGLGDSAEGFAEVRRGYTIDMARDMYPHPDFQLEWWYVTANLELDDGTPLGIQWTLFRRAAAPGPLKAEWSSPHFWMGHAAITTADRHMVAETLLRAPDVRWNDADYGMAFDGWGMDAGPGAAADNQGDGPLHLHYTGSDFGYQLDLKPQGPFVRHGDGGFSQKSDRGQASYYFSQPFYHVGGYVTLDGEKRRVTGSAWLDREWSSQPLDRDQKGWDWFSLHLPSGAKLMLFQLRNTEGGVYRSGSWIAADGTLSPLGPRQIKLTPLDDHQVAGRRLPVRWRLELPEQDTVLTVGALNPNSWMDTLFGYWEGPVTFTGMTGKNAVDGRGYLEMTGYEKTDNPAKTP